MLYKDFLSMTSSLSINGISGFNISRLISSIDQKVKDLGLSDREFLFYPKGIFTEKELELLFFMEKEIISFKLVDSHTYQVTTKFNRGIQHIQMECSTENIRSGKMTIVFMNGDIVLDAEEDTNSSWAEKQTESIEEIYKLLVRAK